MNTKPTTDSIDTQRRNITKLALWTPPVMMTLMLSKRASADSSSSVDTLSGPPADTWGSTPPASSTSTTGSLGGATSTY